MGDIVFNVIVWVMPVAVVLGAWWRYLAVHSTPVKDLFRFRAALVLLSLSLCIWLGVWTLMSRNHGLAAISPGSLFLINLVLGLASFLFWRFTGKDIPTTRSLRRAVGTANGVLLLLWLLFASNPH